VPAPPFPAGTGAPRGTRKAPSGTAVPRRLPHSLREQGRQGERGKPPQARLRRAGSPIPCGNRGAEGDAESPLRHGCAVPAPPFPAGTEAPRGMRKAPSGTAAPRQLPHSLREQGRQGGCGKPPQARPCRASSPIPCGNRGRQGDAPWLPCRLADGGAVAKRLRGEIPEKFPSKIPGKLLHSGDFSCIISGHYTWEWISDPVARSGSG